MDIKEIQPEIYHRFEIILQKNKLSHAYLFSGGFGSLEMAIWLTQALFCDNPSNNLPCGICRSCRLVAENDFADMHLVEPDGQTIKTDQIRALQTTFSQSGFESARQVVIINGAEKMHVNAANALLKSIEEPESDIYIFLLTENENLVLDTIKSRSQIFNFPRQSEYLKEYLVGQGILPNVATIVSKLASSPEDALNMAQDSWFEDACRLIKKLSQLILEQPADSYLFIPNLLGRFKEKNQQKIAFSLLQIYLSDKLPDKKASSFLERTFKAQRMWSSNVNFQSSLEFIILDGMVNK